MRENCARIGLRLNEIIDIGIILAHKPLARSHHSAAFSREHLQISNRHHHAGVFGINHRNVSLIIKSKHLKATGQAGPGG